jgi:hypothetical protein
MASRKGRPSRCHDRGLRLSVGERRLDRTRSGSGWRCGGLAERRMAALFGGGVGFQIIYRRVDIPGRSGYLFDVTQIEQDILQTLVELDEAVQAMRTANPKLNLVPLFTKLDELAAQLPPEADPELRHFLQRKSYEKARARLERRFAVRGLRPLSLNPPRVWH